MAPTEGSGTAVITGGDVLSVYSSSFTRSWKGSLPFTGSWNSVFVWPPSMT